jgi:plasmid replication initiation protein
MTNNLIVKSNQVVEAGYELTTNEQRLILLGISKIPKEQDVNPNIGYEITAQEFATAYNIHPKTAYRELKEATNKLYERSIIIRNEQQTMKVRWASSIITDNPYFSDVLPNEDWKRVVLFFSPQIVPYLSNLKTNFTQYLQSDISNVSGAYTIRFYELVCQYRTIGKREISIQDLRFILNIGDKYPLFYDFKRRVIEPSIKEINDKTPIQISYEQKKKGKTVVGIVLKFKEKPKQAQIATETLKATSDSLNTIKPLTEPQIAKYSMILCKLGSISDLAGTMDYPTFANWLGNILRDPKNSNQETVKRVFKALKTETDYGKKN